ncbi:murein biosynthesis integral membrane protein MurJ [soil metagenome]
MLSFASLVKPGIGQLNRKYVRSTSIVGGMTLLSRVLGLGRDIVFSRFFGAGPVMDAFLVAFRIPNLGRRLFAEGAFSQAFVPVISEFRTTRDHEEVRRLADGVAGTLGLALFVVTLAGVIAAPILVFVFAPGFAGDAAQYELAVAMLRLTFPYLLFISMTALAGGILNTYGRFGVPAFTPVLLNVVLIVFAAVIAPRMPEPGLGLALGVLVAGIVQLLFQLPFLARIGVVPRPRWGWSHEGVRRIGKLMLPALFGSSVAQLNILIDTLIASLLAAGSISWLYYSDRLMEFPLGVFGIALATVILPGLSRQHAEQRPELFSATLDWALRLTLLIGMPAAVGLWLLAAPMVVTIFEYGEFTSLDARMASYSLMAYAAGLLGFIFVKVLAPGYFARQDTRTPVRIGIIALVANMGLNGMIVAPMVVLDVPAPHAGLALATTVSAFLNAFLLYRGLLRNGVLLPGHGWKPLMARIAAANVTMGAVLWWMRGDLADWLTRSGLDRAVWLAASIAAGAVVYFATLWLTGARSVHLRAP